MEELLKDILTELQQIRQQSEPVKEVFSVREAARYLSISEYTLREWVRMRKVPHNKINKQIRFKKSKLDRWLDRNEVSTSV
jgi:excisionase family DNA binding protein